MNIKYYYNSNTKCFVFQKTSGSQYHYFEYNVELSAEELRELGEKCLNIRSLAQKIHEYSRERQDKIILEKVIERLIENGTLDD